MHGLMRLAHLELFCKDDVRPGSRDLSFSVSMVGSFNSGNIVEFDQIVSDADNGIKVREIIENTPTSFCPVKCNAKNKL